MSNSNITEKAIQQVFLELLNERPLSKITIRDITDRCGINRNTFYYHYQDILDLLEEFCASEVDRVVERYPKLNSIDECIDGIMDLVQSNRRAVMHIFNSSNREIYISSLWRVCEHMIRIYADTVFADVPLTDEDRNLFIRYYKCSCFGLILDWIDNGMRDDYVEAAHRICQLKKGSAELTIQNALKSYKNEE